MSTLTVRFPDSLLTRVRDLAQQDGISIDQFIATAVARKLAALMTEEYLEEKAKHGSRDQCRPR